MSRAKDLFLDALDLEPDQRDAFLQEQADGDLEVLREARELLSASEGSTHVFGERVMGTLGAPVRGDRIGPYELDEPIGEGGFATVWRANQEAPVRRAVAIKVLKAAAASDAVLARFEIERQALALMNHPNIARVFDGGISADLRPWFSMELVDGVPMTEYCARHELDKKERLLLFLDVCRAVQHAHQKGVIHRDLKPSNVLVAQVDGRAVPKVIDFGIAKAVDSSLDRRVTLTLEGQILGTPAYMAPEQIDAQQDIDTRVDVYALGVLLYEILSGVRPFQDETLAAAGLAEILRVIREVDPPRPSSRLESTTRILPREIRGDLDWIVMRCLEKRAERRYDSASLLATEVERHLAGEAVLAGPPNAAYHARKFIARHRVALSFVATVAVLLLAGIVATTVQLRRARAAELRQGLEIQKLKESTDFFESILLGAGPAVALGDDTRLIERLLAAALERIERDLKGSPEVEGSVQFAVASALYGIGRLGGAEASYRRAIELQRRQADEPPLALARSLMSLGGLLLETERPDDGREALVEAGSLVADLAAEHPVRLQAEAALATLARREGRADEAEPLLRRIVHTWASGEGFVSDSAILALNNHGSTLLDLGRNEEAISVFKRALTHMEALHGPLHPGALASLNNVAMAHMDLGQLEEALPFMTSALELKRNALPPGHMSLTIGLNNLANVYEKLQRLDDARGLYDEALEAVRANGSEESPTAIRMRFNRGRVINAQGKLEEALDVYRGCVTSAKATFGPEHPITVGFHGSVGWQLVTLDRAAEAEPWILTSFEATKDDYPSPTSAVNHIRLGGVLKRLGRAAEGRELLQKGLNALRESDSAASLSAWVEIAKRELKR